MWSVIIVVVVVVVLVGCLLYDSVMQCIVQSIMLYWIIVVQGNFVLQEKVVQLQVGMMCEQVCVLFGILLLVDMFYVDCWDYFFYFKCGLMLIVQQCDFVVNFLGDCVMSWIGVDNLLFEFDLLVDIDGDCGGKKVKVVVVVKKVFEVVVVVSVVQVVVVVSLVIVLVFGVVVDQDVNVQVVCVVNCVINQVLGQGLGLCWFMLVVQVLGGVLVLGGQLLGVVLVIQLQFQFYCLLLLNVLNEVLLFVGL